MAGIYDFKAYKPYLAASCSEERGMLTRLSEAAGCQKSYLSACLSGKNNLTLDHALGMSEILGLSESEKDYFFLMIEKEKAATAALKHRLESKMKELVREAYKLKNQQSNTVILNQIDAGGIGIYYSTWILAAIHTLTSVAKFQSTAALAKRLNLNVETMSSYLTQLESLDLVKKENGKYRWNSSNMHLADSSVWISNHHLNWRFRAIDSFQKRDPESLHYTAIQSMSEEDFETLKKKIAQFIKEFNKVSDPSDPEEAFCWNLDFFRV